VAQALARRRRRAGLLAARREKLRPHYAFRGHGRGRLNVTVVLRNAAKPTSSTYIRLYSPLNSTAFGRRVGLDIVDEKALWISPLTTVCIVQRTAFSKPSTARKFLAEARRRGCLVIVDSDDAFSALDPEHPQYALQIERAAILDSVMAEADEVWLSTQELLAAHPGDASHVVRNTLDLDLWKPEAARTAALPDDAPLRILYMGTTTHDGDFALIEPVLERLHASYPGQFEVVMVGVARGLAEKPWMRVLKPDDGAYPQFVPWLVAQGPFDIGISPLIDSTFNRAKSDIKCLDYLALGARPVVSDVEPYRVEELDDLIDRVGNDPDAWYTALEDLVKRRAELRHDLDGRRGAGIDYLVDRRSADKTGAHLRARIDDLRAAPPKTPQPTPSTIERHHS
jgi:hypothetical protein